jgi:transketolase
LDEIIDLGSLEKKFEIFGWHVERCDGHDFSQLEKVFETFKHVKDKPKVLIADTVKGKGVSFMEGPVALKDEGGLYKWHAGAPDDDSFEAGYKEIFERIEGRLNTFGFAPLTTELIGKKEKHKARLKDTAEKVVNVFGEALVELGAKRNDIVVLDADLSADCGLRFFEHAFPERFIENGIAEQDMVSMAGGLALQGFLPIVNSFGVFLASRANEHATENTKIIYVCHYAGVIPAGPGKSHQSLRDISLFGALPNCLIIEPCNGMETKSALAWCVDEAEENCMLRLVISPSPRTILLPDNYRFIFGKGNVVNDGKDAVLFTYGPVMLHEALLASEILKDRDFSLKIVNLPWLNRVDTNWLEETLADCKTIFVLDNHSQYGGLGDSLLNATMLSNNLRGRRLIKFAIEDYPACGTPQEALSYHKLDGKSLVSRVLSAVGVT